MTHCASAVQDSDTGLAGLVVHARTRAPIHCPIHRRIGYL